MDAEAAATLAHRASSRWSSRTCIAAAASARRSALLALPGAAGARQSVDAACDDLAKASAVDAERFVDALREAGFTAYPLEAATGAGRARPTTERLPAAPRRRRVCRRQHHVAVGRRLVGRRRGHAGFAETLFHWLSALIALPAVAYAGQPFFASARQALAARRLNMDVPISLGVILATAMSLFQTVRGSEQVYFDAAITLLFFLLIGRHLDQACAQGRRAQRRICSACGRPRRPSFVRTARPSALRLERSRRGCACSSRRASARRSMADRRRQRHRSTTASSRAKVGRDASRRRPDLRRHDQSRRSPRGDRHRSRREHAARRDRAADADGRAGARQLCPPRRSRRAALRAGRTRLGLATFVGWLIAGQGWEPALTAAIAVLIITCPCALALAVPGPRWSPTSRLFKRGVDIRPPMGWNGSPRSTPSCSTRPGR